MAKRRPNRQHALGFGAGAGGSALVSLIVYLLVALLGGGGPGRTISITLGGPHGTPTQTIELPTAAVDAAKATDLADHEKLRGEEPVGVSAAALSASHAQQRALARNSGLPDVLPDAAPEQRGCATRLVQNYSSRHGTPPRVEVLHYTVSANRPGWSDVLAITSLFDRPAFSASSNYVLDAEGNCAYIVRETDKAWTQAAANPFSISYEVVNTGHESTYAGTAGLAKLGMVLDYSTARWKIPLQRAVVRDCLVVRPGIIDHHGLGLCGGGHFDISPPFSVDAVIAAARRSRAGREGAPPPALPLCTVRLLQARLDHGLAADGQVGPRTRSAIRRLQRAHGIPATGYAGVRVSKILRLRACAV
jgi:hypothetical protein